MNSRAVWAGRAAQGLGRSRLPCGSEARPPTKHKGGTFPERRGPQTGQKESTWFHFQVCTFLLEVRLDHVSASVLPQRMVFMLVRISGSMCDISRGVSPRPAQGALGSIVHHGLATLPRAVRLAGLNPLPAWSLIVSEVAPDDCIPREMGPCSHH